MQNVIVAKQRVAEMQQRTADAGVGFGSAVPCWSNQHADYLLIQQQIKKKTKLNTHTPRCCIINVMADDNTQQMSMAWSSKSKRTCMDGWSNLQKKKDVLYCKRLPNKEE